MSVVDVQFIVNGNFEQFTAEVKAANSAMAQLTATSGKLAATTRMNEVMTNFRQGMAATNAFEHSLVNVTTAAESFGQALGKNRLSYREASAAASEFRRSGTGVIRTLAQQQLAIENSVAAFRRMPDGRVVAEMWRPTTLAVNDFASEQKLASIQASILNQTLRDQYTQLVNSGKNMQWAGRQISMGLTFPIVALGAASAKTFYDMDQQLTRITKVYGDNTTQMTLDTGKLRSEMIDLAKQMNDTYAQSSSDTLGLAADIAALGKTGTDLTSNVTQVTRLATLGEVDRQEAMKATLSLQSAFKLSNDELAKSINFLNQVENSTSATLQDLVEAIPRAGPVVQGLGGDVQDLAMYMVAMREGGIGAAEGANALKSGLGSIIAPSKDAMQYLNNFGINMKQIVNQNAGDLTGTIITLKGQLDDLTSTERQQALVKLFGKYQYARMGALFQNIGEPGSQTAQVEKIMGMGADTLAQAADREIKRTTESASGRFKKMIQGLQIQLASMGQAILPIFTGIGKALTKIFELFNALPDGVNTFVLAIAGIAAAIGPVVMTLGVLRNFYGTFMQGMLTFRSFIQRRFRGLDVKPYEHMTAEMKAQQMYTAEWGAKFTEATNPAGVFTTQIEKLTMALRELAAQEEISIASTSGLVSGLYSQGTAVQSATLPAAIRDVKYQRLDKESKNRGIFIGGSGPGGTNTMQGGRSYTPEQLAALGPQNLAAQRVALNYMSSSNFAGQTGLTKSSMSALYTKINTALGEHMDPTRPPLSGYLAEWDSAIRTLSAKMSDSINKELAYLETADAETRARYAAYTMYMSEAEVNRSSSSSTGPIRRFINVGAAQAAGLRGPGMSPLNTVGLLGNQTVPAFTNAPLVNGLKSEMEHLISDSTTLDNLLKETNRIEKEFNISLEEFKTEIARRITTSKTLALTDEQIAEVEMAFASQLQQLMRGSEVLSGSFSVTAKKLGTVATQLEFDGVKLTDKAAQTVAERFGLLANETSDTISIFHTIDAKGRNLVSAINTATGEMATFSVGARGGVRSVAPQTAEVANRMLMQTEEIMAAQVTTEEKIAALRSRGLLLEDDRLAIEVGELGLEKNKTGALQQQLNIEKMMTEEEAKQLELARARTAATAAGAVPGAVAPMGMASRFKGFVGRNAGTIGMVGLGAGMGASMIPVSSNPLVSGIQGAGNAAMLGGSMGMMIGPEGAAIGAIGGALIGAGQSFWRYMDDKAKEAAMEAHDDFEKAFTTIDYRIDPKVANDFGVKIREQVIGAFSKLPDPDFLSSFNTSHISSEFSDAVSSNFSDVIEQMKNAGVEDAKSMANSFYAGLIRSGMPAKTAQKIVQSVIDQADKREIVIDVMANISKVKTSRAARRLAMIENQKALDESAANLDTGEAEDRYRELGALEGKALLDGLGKNSDPKDLMRGFWKSIDDIGARALENSGTNWGELINSNLTNAFAPALKEVYGMTGNLNKDLRNFFEMSADARKDFMDQLERADPAAADAFSGIIASASTAARVIGDELPAKYQYLLAQQNQYMNGASALIGVLNGVTSATINYFDAMAKVGDLFQNLNFGIVTVSDKDIEREKKQMDAWVKQEQRQAEAAHARIDDQRSALQDQQESVQNSMDKMNREYDKQEREINKHYDAEIRDIQREENAINRQDEKRQQAFEHEQARIQRLQELRTNAINIREAVSEGNLYEAARLRMDREAMRQQNAAEDAQARADRRSERRTRRLEQQRRDIERQRRERLRAINQERREEQKRYNERLRHIQNEMDALDKQDEAIDDHLDYVEKRAKENVRELKKLQDQQVADQETTQRKLAAIWDDEGTTMLQKFKKTYALLGDLTHKQATQMVKMWEQAFGDMPDNAAKAMVQGLQNGQFDRAYRVLARQIGIPTKELTAIEQLLNQHGEGISVSRGPHGNLQFHNQHRPEGHWRGGYIDGHRNGGYINGRGGATTDSIPTHVSNGEYIVRQPAVQRYGKGFFDTINYGSGHRGLNRQSHGGYAQGGLVGQAENSLGLMGSLMVGGSLAAAKMMQKALKGAFRTGSAGGRYVAGQPGVYGDTRLTAEQLKNAATIMSVGRHMGMSHRDLIVGIMTALQESMLRNVNYGTYDSLGLFQQRASWGTAQQRMNPRYASRQFFLRLKSIKDRDEMALWQEAQAVQVSAYPRAYAQWEDEARAIARGMSQQTNLPRGASAGKIVHWDGEPIDQLTAAQLRIAGHLLGRRYNVFQGSFQPATSYSGTTHTGGGVIDAGPATGVNARSVVDLQRAGFAAWYRGRGAPGAAANYPPHIHAISLFDKSVSATAAGQRMAYVTRTGDGLGDKYYGPHARMLPGLRMQLPGLREGGTVRFDNTIANLHRGERVLTEPLTQKFEQAISRMATGGGDEYNFDVKVINPQSELDIEKAITSALNKRDTKLGRLRIISGGKK